MFMENNNRPDWIRSHKDFRSWSRKKVRLAISWCGNYIMNLVLKMFTRSRNCQIAKLEPNEVFAVVVF